MTDDELLEKGEEIIRAIRVAREALRGERVKLREDVAAMREEMREAREEEMRAARAELERLCQPDAGAAATETRRARCSDGRR